MQMEIYLNRASWKPKLFEEFQALDEPVQKQIIDGMDDDLRSDFSHQLAVYIKSTVADTDDFLTPFSAIDEKEPEFLIPNYVPKGAITLLAGSGGVGKTSAYCALVAAIAEGKAPFLLGDFPENWHQEPFNVAIFSGEDSPEHILKKKLRLNGAEDCTRIFTLSQADERFSKVNFTSEYLEKIVRANHLDLVVFDPVQAFTPANLKMSERNAIRSCMRQLISLSERYGTTFLIVVHTNKQAGVWGRKRIADSADLWDASRSVLMIGEADNNGLRYLSVEKSNYAERDKTVLFTLDDGVVQFQGYSDKHDREFVIAGDNEARKTPALSDAKSYILDRLEDGALPTRLLEDECIKLGISRTTLERAKTTLRKERKIEYVNKGYGAQKSWYIQKT